VQSHGLRGSLPLITEKKEPPKDWKQWEGVPNKYKNHFSEKPGTGD